MASSSLSSILLAYRDSSAVLGPFDGKVAAAMGKCLYTTPNEDFIPIPWSSEREVCIREDFRYGPDDPTVWPQPYSERFPHLGLIIRSPKDTEDPLHFLRWNPTPSDFVASGRGIAEGIGRLSQQHLSTFQTHVNEIRSRFKAYTKKLNGKPVNPVASLLDTALNHSFVRLSSLPATYLQVRFGVTELQRFILELRAIFDYLEVFKEVMNGAIPPAANTSQFIGAFTTNPRIVQDFHLARIPVWYVRDLQTSTANFVNNVLTVVNPIHFNNTVVTKKHNGFPVIFKGKADPAEIVDIVHGYSRRWLSSQDPFDVHPFHTAPPSHPLPLPQQAPPQAGPSSSSSASASKTLDNNPRPKKRQKKGGARAKISAPLNTPANQPPPRRDLYTALEGQLVPFAMPWWAQGLREVDQSQPPALEPIPAKARRYSFPDPGIFINVSEERRQQMIESWLRVSDAWASARTPGKGLTNQEWRDLLFINFAAPLPTGSADTKTAQLRARALEMVLPCGTTFRSQEGLPFEWEEQIFPPGTTLSPLTIRQIVYHLYELNFRHDLLELDDLANEKLDHRDTEEVFRRQLAIYRLFTDDRYAYPKLTPPNTGLAADNVRERLPFYMAFACIMDDWRGDKPDVFRYGHRHMETGISTPIAHALELACAKFYCQQFYNYFRRAPQIPGRLFEPSTQP